MAIDAIGPSCPQNRMRAAPPSTVKIGAPSKAARKSRNSAGVTSVAGSTGGKTPIATSEEASRTASPTPLQRSDDWRINRNVMTAKPRGRTDWTTQRGTP